MTLAASEDPGFAPRQSSRHVAHKGTVLSTLLKVVHVVNCICGESFIWSIRHLKHKLHIIIASIGKYSYSVAS